MLTNIGRGGGADRVTGITGCGWLRVQGGGG